MGIPEGAAGRLKQQAKTFPDGGNAPRAVTTAQDIHRSLMGRNHTLNSTVMGGNSIGEATGTTAALAAPAAARCREGGYGMVRTDGGCEIFWSSSDKAGFFEKTSEIAVGCQGESNKCATFKIQAVEAANLRVFVGMVKGDAELKILHSMLEYNDFFC